MEEEQAVSTEQVAEEVVESVETETPAEETREAEPKAEEAAASKEEAAVTLPPPRKKTAQERIDEITRARREAEREAEYWRRVAKEKAQAEQAPKPEAPAIPPRPKVEQFETTEEYEDALFAWRDQKREIETRMDRMQREQESDIRAFNARSQKLRAEYEDFDEMIEQPVFSPAMRLALLKSEYGPEVAYFLGRPENRSTAEKIMSLPVEIQLYELGKLETNLLVAKKTRKVPSAPAPISPVASGGMSGEIDISRMTMDEFMEYERKKKIAKFEAAQKGRIIR